MAHFDLVMADFGHLIYSVLISILIYFNNMSFRSGDARFDQFGQFRSGVVAPCSDVGITASLAYVRLMRYDYKVQMVFTVVCTTSF